MNQLTIRQKLYAVFSVLILIFTCISLYSGYTLYAIHHGAMRIATEHLNSVLSLSQANRTLAVYRKGEYAMVAATNTSGQIYAAQEIRNLAGQMDVTFAQLTDVLTGDKAESFEAMREQWDAYKQRRTRLEQLTMDGQHEAALQELARTDADYQQLNWQLSLLVDASKDFVQQEVNEATSRYEAARLTLIIAVVLVILLSMGMALYLSRSINRSVAYLMHISKEVAAGNLTVEVEQRTQDEFGVLTGAYKETVEHLHALIEHIQHTAEQVAQFAGNLTENANQSAQATLQIANSVSNVAAASSQQGENIGSSRTEVIAMAKDLDGFAQKAESSNEAAQQVDKIAQQGRDAMQGAVQQMKEIADSVGQSAKAIRLLADRSAEIGQISDTISGIADQTNLLSLNVAIEAARAGEAGRGFAVVAEEVRKLAEESGRAAQKIAALIDAIQQETQEAVTRMERGTQKVADGQAVIAQAGDSFQTITEAVGDLTAQSWAILAGARHSAGKAEAIVNVMEDIHTSSQSVAEETESVSAATEEQSASMDEVAEASRRLSELSQELQSAAAQFRI